MSEMYEALQFPTAHKPRKQITEPQLGTVLAVEDDGIRFMLDAFGFAHRFGPAPYTRGSRRPILGDRVLVEFAGRGVGRPVVTAWWGDGELSPDIDLFHAAGSFSGEIQPTPVVGVLTETEILIPGIWQVEVTARVRTVGGSGYADLVVRAGSATVDLIDGAQGATADLTATASTQIAFTTQMQITDAGTLEIAATASGGGYSVVDSTELITPPAKVSGYTAVRLSTEAS